MAALAVLPSNSSIFSLDAALYIEKIFLLAIKGWLLFVFLGTHTFFFDVFFFAMKKFSEKKNFFSETEGDLLQLKKRRPKKFTLKTRSIEYNCSIVYFFLDFFLKIFFIGFFFL
jgi:hypothetical protein